MRKHLLIWSVAAACVLLLTACCCCCHGKSDDCGSRPSRKVCKVVRCPARAKKCPAPAAACPQQTVETVTFEAVGVVADCGCQNPAPNCCTPGAACCKACNCPCTIQPAPTNPPAPTVGPVNPAPAQTPAK